VAGEVGIFVDGAGGGDGVESAADVSVPEGVVISVWNAKARAKSWLVEK